MIEYNVQSLEGLATHIDGLLNTRGTEIYLANRTQNLPRVAMAVQGIYGEDQPIINFKSGDPTLDAIFNHIIDPNNITGIVRRGGGEYECNLIRDDINRNGLGPNQYERIANSARGLILKELEKEDETGDSALTYLESKAKDSNQRWRARRDWVEFLGSYAHRERIIRDKSYLELHESFMRGEKVDVDSVKEQLPSAVTSDRLYSLAVRIMEYEMQKAVESGDFFNYFIRLDLMQVFDKIGTPEAMQKIKERFDDEREHTYIKETATRILEV